MSLDEAVAYIGVSRAWLMRQKRSGKLRPLPSGVRGKLFFRTRDLERLIDETMSTTDPREDMDFG
jgi:predicted site-specific integrase-resolvase